MPTVLGTTCTDNGGGYTDITVTLPSWSDGDLALIFVSTDSTRTWTTTDGYTDAASDTSTHASLSIWYRKLQTGDGNPTFTANVARRQNAIAVIIDAGTYDDTDILDQVTTDGSFNTGTSSTPTATAITTDHDDSEAFAVASMDGAHTPYSVTTSGWSETHSADCTAVGRGQVVANKTIASAGSTGNVEFSQGSSNEWMCAIIAIKASGGAPPVGDAIQDIIGKYYRSFLGGM